MDFLNVSFFQITQVLKNGFRNLQLVIFALSSFLLTVEVLFTGFGLAVKKERAEQEIMGKLLQIFIWSIALHVFPYLMEYVAVIFTKIGLLAGGDINANGNEVLQPGNLLHRGLIHAKPIYEAAESQGISHIGTAFFYWVCWFIMMGCYVMMTGQFFLTYIEFYVLMGVGGIFLSFGYLKQTRFLAEKFLGSVLAHGVKILLFNFMVGAIGQTLNEIDSILESSLKLDYIMASITTAIVFFVIIRYIPQMATGILSGTPTLSSPTFGGLLAGVAALGAAGMAARAGARVLGTAGRKSLHGALVGMGGTGKAISAGVSAARNLPQISSDAGTTFSRLQQFGAGIKATGHSALGSMGTTAANLGRNAVGRAMHGKGYKNMPKYADPDSLKNARSIPGYLKNRWNKGAEVGDRHAAKAVNSKLGYNTSSGMTSVPQPFSDGSGMGSPGDPLALPPPLHPPYIPMPGPEYFEKDAPSDPLLLPPPLHMPYIPMPGPEYFENRKKNESN